MRFFTLLGSLLAAWCASSAELRFDFSTTPEGKTPTNFSAGLFGAGPAPAWQTISDEVPSAFAPFAGQAQTMTRQTVLAQTSQDPTDERFPLLVYNGEEFRDFKFTARFKIVSGVTEQMAGVVFRFQNTSNFYVLRASALGKNIGFYKVVNGERQSPVIVATSITTNVWHSLTVDCSGIYIEVSLDGQKALPTITDKSPPDGKIGFWTKSDAVSHFTEAVVSYTPRIPAAQSLINTILKSQPRILGLRIYTLATTNSTRILASKELAELGQPGTEAELKALQEGAVSFGRESGTVIVTLPLHDRNGEPIAAVRIKLKSFLGEMQNNAITRATTIVKSMQEICTSGDDLLK
ncbi:MAG: hypothetical protein WCS94_00730 [Verrucomicrobiota bacterium]